ncbi:MAG TPA: extracellular solute-binding protein [Trueperaceae bacterium]|nr:extracellular solute-binding protein [Trueperaceae bacterium]
MKRSVTTLGVVLALLLAAPAFAQDWENVDPSGQTVTFWHQHTRDRETALEKIVQEFNDTNEWGITVDAEYQGGYNDIYKKMVSLLGTADTPNLVVAYQNQAATYELVDGLVDMSPLVNSPKWGISPEDQADFFPGFWNSDIFPTFDNKRLGLAPNRSMEMMYYNADWLKELKAAGKIDFDGPPVTPEQFTAAACAASNTPFSGATASGSPIGYEMSADASRFASFTFAHGGNVYDSTTNRYTLDSQAAMDAMNWLQDMFTKGCAQLQTEAYGDQTDFGNGRLLFAVSSSSGLPFYRDAVDAAAAFDWSVAAIPHTTPEPVMNIYGASVSMPAGHSPEQTLAAWLFLKYYTGTKAQTEWAIASEYFPVRKSVAEGLADFFDAHPAYKTAFDLLPYGISEPNVPGYDPVRDNIASEMVAIADGEDVAETLHALNQQANLILDDQLSQLPSN